MRHSIAGFTRPNRPRRGHQFRPEGVTPCESRLALSGTGLVVTSVVQQGGVELVTIQNTGTQKEQAVVADYGLINNNFDTQQFSDFAVANIKPGDSKTLSVKLICGEVNQLDFFTTTNPGGQNEGVPSLVQQDPFEYYNETDLISIPFASNVDLSQANDTFAYQPGSIFVNGPTCC